MDKNVETSAVSLNDIKTYWEKASEQPLREDDLRPTARDPYLQQLVEAAIEKWIWPGAKVIDIGCGDGTSTLKFAQRAGFVHGVDYIVRYVDLARQQAIQRGVSNVEFAAADVMDLTQTRKRVGSVDIAITIRCLINLASWENQLVALREIAGLVRPGGLYLLSEGWSDAWMALNRWRSRSGLSQIELVKYNCLLNRNRFEQHVSEQFEILHYENLGFFIFMSRVFQPAFVHPAPPTHLHSINRVAAMLLNRGVGAEEFRDVDYAGVYVLRRK